jgi:serine/threonine protein kinase
LGGLVDAKYQFQQREIKSIIKQILEALEYLHEKRIIHRDIKSSNILISNMHVVKLADFGLARMLPSLEVKDSKPDMTNNVITLWYRPPELLLGSTRYTSTVDIWSVGCVLAELELSRPFLPGKTEVITTICYLFYATLLNFSLGRAVRIDFSYDGNTDRRILARFFSTSKL